MAAILSSLRNTVIAGFVLTIILVLLLMQLGTPLDRTFWTSIVRWLHVGSGVMWIGLLWYFNFVQTPSMPKIPDDQKPAISKVISPAALFWFRWGAMSTIFFGLILAHLNGYMVGAVTLGASEGFAVPKDITIGIGMWLGTIMWFNVWFVIWPNQKIALGLVDAAADQKPKAAKLAGQFSRINTLLSIPMLLAMVAAKSIV